MEDITIDTTDNPKVKNKRILEFYSDLNQFLIKNKDVIQTVNYNVTLFFKGETVDKVKKMKAKK